MPWDVVLLIVLTVVPALLLLARDIRRDRRKWKETCRRIDAEQEAARRRGEEFLRRMRQRPEPGTWHVEVVRPERLQLPE